MKVLITGFGRMGQLIEETLLADETQDNEVVCRVDITRDEEKGIVDAAALEEMDKVADLIIDFSNPSLTDALTAYAYRTETPVLSGTTNLTTVQLDNLQALGEKVPVIWASNYSFGINLLRHLVSEIAPVLNDWDIEVTETHHNKKVDAPSGTAKTLIDAMDPKGERTRVYGREGNCGARTKGEIGVHAVRGGTVVGEHKVQFFGIDEVFELTHQMGSRQILVNGAIGAAKRLLEKEPGFYSMDDLLFG